MVFVRPSAVVRAPGKSASAQTGLVGTNLVDLVFLHSSSLATPGVARLLLKAATDQAFKLGAGEVEGYPVVPKDPTGSMPAAFAWTGVPTLFEAAGYRELPRHELSGQEGHRRVFLKAAARWPAKSAGTRRKR
jgi:hypothetical protein